jgi:hypothetical protein
MQIEDVNKFNTGQSNYHIVPTGLYSGSCFTFYQYIVPMGQSQQD